MASSRHHRHRRQAGSPRDSAVLEVYAVPVGAGVPANTGEAGAIRCLLRGHARSHKDWRRT